MRALTSRLFAFFLSAITATVAVAAPNQGPTVSLTSPAAGSSYNAPATIALAATASDPDGTVAKVEFYAGTTLIGTSTAAPYAATWTNAAAGTYSLTAKAYDNLGKATTSAAVSVTVVNVTTVITSPADGATVTDSIVTVSGTFVGPDNTTIILTAGGGHSTAFVGAGGAFGANVQLSPGPNTIEVQIARRDGTSEVVTSRVTYSPPPVVAFTSPAFCGPYNVPIAITFTADAQSLYSSITRVVFDDNGTAIGTATNAPYTINPTITSFGTRFIRATAYDANGATSSATLVILTRTQPPTITLTAPVDGVTYKTGDMVPISATASDPDGTISNVSFYADGQIVTQVSTAPYNSGNRFFTAGAHTIFARATDNSGATADSATVTVNIIQDQPPTVAITSPANNSTFGAPADITLSATASDPDGTIKSVEFQRNGIILGTLTAPPYTLVTQNVPAATYTYTAVAQDDSGAVSRTSITVNVVANAAPTVSITAPASGSTFTAPVDVTVTANASDSDGTITKVDFFANGARIGSATSAPYTIVWPNPFPGSYSLVARATDNLGAGTTSAPVSVTIGGTAVSITQPADGTRYDAPATFNVGATAKTGSGTISRLDLLDGGVVVGSIPNVNLSSVNATFTLQAVAAGTHAYTVQATTSANTTATSAAVNVVVVTPPSVAITAPGANAFYIAPAMLSMTAAPRDFVNPIAKVEYFASGVLVGTVTATPYDFTWANAAAGNYTLTAKITDSSGVSATSPAVPVVVASAPTIVVAAGIDGSTVPDGSITVTGTTQTELNSSVSVNGKVGDISPDGSFVVSEIPLAIGTNTLTVKVYTVDGVVATNIITVTRSGSNPIILQVDPLSAFAPQSVTFTIANLAGIAVKKVEMDFTGAGTLQDITALGAKFTVSFPSAGVMWPRVIVTEQLDRQYVARTGIILRTPADLSAVVRSVVGGMLDQLRYGDSTRALNRVSPDLQADYMDIFNALTQSGDMPTALREFGTLQQVTLNGEIAEAMLVRDTTEGRLAFWIYVIRGKDGIWRIDGM